MGEINADVSLGTRDHDLKVEPIGRDRLQATGIRLGRPHGNHTASCGETLFAAVGELPDLPFSVTQR